METIISAVISAAAAIIACVINNNKVISMIEYRLQQLEEKQDKYNNVIRRTYELEKAEGIFNERLIAATDRIDDLEDFHKS